MLPPDPSLHRQRLFEIDLLTVRYCTCLANHGQTVTYDDKPSRHYGHQRSKVSKDVMGYQGLHEGNERLGSALVIDRRF